MADGEPRAGGEELRASGEKPGAGGKDRGVKVLSSALGLGHLPFMPGTWSSAGATLVYVAVRQLPWPWWMLAMVGLVMTAIVFGLMACPQAQRVYGSEDPRPFVLDEVAGQWLTFVLFWPWSEWWSAAAGFAAFRLFDILKPPPVRNAEKLPGAWGPTVDDLAAAVCAALLLWLIHLLLLLAT